MRRETLPTRTGIALVSLVQLGLLGWACVTHDGGSRDSDRHNDPQSATPAFNTPSTQGEDSMSIARYVASRGYVNIETIAERDKYYAVIARTAQEGPLHLLPLQLTRDSVVPLHTPMELAFGAPSLMRWLSLASQTTSALQVTFDDRVEGNIRTEIYAVRGYELSLTYRDSLACRPAEVQDLDGDGVLELISYVEDPSRGDCGDDCHLELWQRFHMVPSWVEMHRWTGQEWKHVEGQFPQFYADLADKYAAMRRWLLEDPDREWCARTQWLRPGTLNEWESRARRLSEGIE